MHMKKSHNAGFMTPVTPRASTLEPLPLRQVSLSPSGYWGEWQRVNSVATLEHSLLWMERVGWIDNFRLAAQGKLPEGRRGREFTDADVYKIIEALSWEFGRTGNTAINKKIVELTELIKATQESDGYLNTKFGRDGQASRYSDLEWGHELYNYGHLFHAAVARFRTVGVDELVELSIRAADHVCEAFGEAGIQSVCGHPGVETGLVELGRALGNESYINQAKLFIDRRGTGTLKDIEFGRSYFQDDTPIREADVFRGHAVRALYLAAGAVDLAVETSDSKLIEIIELQLANTVARRTYITGGMGSHHQDEAFGEDFELPTDRAYCETCAGVASVMLSWRLLLSTGNPNYGDLMERTLHNIVATSPSRDGKTFFYANTLHQRVPGVTSDPNNQSPRASSSQRSAWFEVACCPTNIARLFATIQGYAATKSGKELQIHLYSSGEIEAALDSGVVKVAVSTEYPFDGKVTLTMQKAPSDWKLVLRVPEWAKGASILQGGQTSGLTAGSSKVLDDLAEGDQLVLQLPYEARFTWPKGRIDSIRGTVAVERGPLVYCVESSKINDRHVDLIRVNTSKNPFIRDGKVYVWAQLLEESDESWPYFDTPQKTQPSDDLEIELTPYCNWGETAPGTMRIWMPVLSD